MRTTFKNYYKDEDTLFHYCSMESFIKIIESKKIRLGNVMQMNDPTELALRSLDWTEIIYTQYEQDPFDFLFYSNGAKLNMRQYLDLLRCRQGNLKSDSYFAFCMSTLNNDLNQWRVYGDDGRGVCLGFDISPIADLVENNPDFFYVELEYDDLKRLPNLIAQTILCKIRDRYLMEDFVGLKNVIENFTSDIEFFILRYKHIAYKAESEARLIYKTHTNNLTLMNDIVVENGKYNVNTYKEIDLSDLKINTITIGPTNSTPLENILLFLNCNGFKIGANQIIRSDIPYRTK